MSNTPTIMSSIQDPRSKVTYHVMAYRELTREELVLAIRTFHGQRGAKPITAGTEVTIITSMGA